MSGDVDITQLAARRERLGLSRQDLADLIGVNVATVWRWESGETQPIRLALRQLDEVLSRLESERIAAS